MLGLKGAGEIFLGIEAVLKGDIRHGARAIPDTADDLSESALAYVVSRREGDGGAEQAEKMVFGIPRHMGKGGIVQYPFAVVLQMGFDVVDHLHHLGRGKGILFQLGHGLTSPLL